jgi:hypothetical protein
MRNSLFAQVLVMVITANGVDSLSLDLVAAPQRHEIQRIEHGEANWFPSGFGHALAIKGDYCLITNSAVAGSAVSAFSLFRRTANGWLRDGNVMPIAGPLGFSAAMSCALGSDYVAIGLHDWNGRDGAAYVAFLDPVSGTWGLNSQTITAPSSLSTGGQFGRSMCGDDATLVVGAHRESGAFIAEGRVYVFRRPGGVWALDATIAPPANDVQGHSLHFGTQLALHGNTLAITAVGGQTAPYSSGRVYLYTRDSLGQWALQQRLVPNAAAADDYFGWDLDIDGDTLVIGRPRFGLFPVVSVGIAHVYRRDASGLWQLTQTLVASDGYVDSSGGDQFGSSVAVEGDVIAIGAGRGLGSGNKRGAVYIFHKDAATGMFVELERHYPTIDISANFGAPAALDGGTLIVARYGANSADSTAFALSADVDTSICGGATSWGGAPPYLDGFGGNGQSANGGGLVISNCDPAARYLIAASTTGAAPACGPTVLGMQMCICGPLTRFAFGQVASTSTLQYLPAAQLPANASALISVIDILYLQGIVAGPGGRFALTDAIEWPVR